MKPLNKWVQYFYRGILKSETNLKYIAQFMLYFGKNKFNKPKLKILFAIPWFL